MLGLTAIAEQPIGALAPPGGLFGALRSRLSLALGLGL